MKSTTPKGIQVNKLEPLPLQVQLAEQLRYHIEAGTWRPGARLPTVRELAAALRINYNTVRSALQELERGGYVVTEQGRGTFVSTTPPLRSPNEQEALQDIVDEAIVRARAIGMDADAFARTAYSRAKTLSTQDDDVRVLIAECNRPDLEHFVELVDAGTGVRPEPYLLSELESKDPAFYDGFDLLTTPILHVVELADLAREPHRVLGLMVKPSYLDVLFEIAAMPEGEPVGLICATQSSAGQMERALRGVGAAHLDFLKSGMDDEDGIGDLFEKARLVYVSRLALAERREPWPAPEKLRPYIDHIDESGLRLLRRQIAEARGRRHQRSEDDA